MSKKRNPIVPKFIKKIKNIDNQPFITHIIDNIQSKNYTVFLK
jgi:hypothetical protein